jgi:hypothetical protein
MVLSMPLRAKTLDDAERKRLEKALEKIDAADREFAALVRRLGIAAVSREMGLTPQGLLRRVQKIEGQGTG